MFVRIVSAAESPGVVRAFVDGGTVSNLDQRKLAGNQFLTVVSVSEQSFASSQRASGEQDDQT
jgi:hypothetical protein